jgi:hypothetical protein
MLHVLFIAATLLEVPRNSVQLYGAGPPLASAILCSRLRRFHGIGVQVPIFEFRIPCDPIGSDDAGGALTTVRTGGSELIGKREHLSLKTSPKQPIRTSHNDK